MGDDKAAVEKAYEMGKKDLELLSSINPLLAEFIQGMLDDSLNYASIQKMIA